MTAGALAITEQKTKYLAFLKLLFADEVTTESETRDIDPDQVAKYCLFKIESLCNHQKCIDYTPKPEESKAHKLSQPRPGISEDIQKDTYTLGNT